MIERARTFFRESDTAIAVTVGVVGGIALYNLFQAAAYGFILPLFAARLSPGDVPFRFTIGAVTFQYDQLLAVFTSILLLGVLGYVLFIWGGGEPPDATPATRDCPECRSEIWVDSRRCPYCTSMIEPEASDGAG